MNDNFVVAIGSSDGGIEAMKSFFDNAPHDNATYVILRHMPFGQQSRLNEILRRHSKLKIAEVSANTPIDKDIVYMAPGSMYMTIENNHLVLRERKKETLFPNRSVDVFLDSLAKEKGGKSIAVILSGNGSDGLKGATSLKAAGGLVIAQNPDSCKRSSMPLSVIETGITDHVLMPSDMPPVILQYIDAVLNGK